MPWPSDSNPTPRYRGSPSPVAFSVTLEQPDVAVEHAGPQPSADETEDSGVGDPMCEHPQQPLVIDRVEEAAEGGYTARALGESIFTEADSLPALRENVRDAVKCHFENDQAPKIIRLHFVREEVISS
jgi:hypothetical protein